MLCLLDVVSKHALDVIQVTDTDPGIPFYYIVIGENVEGEGPTPREAIRDWIKNAQESFEHRDDADLKIEESDLSPCCASGKKEYYHQHGVEPRHESCGGDSINQSLPEDYRGDINLNPGGGKDS